MPFTTRIVATAAAALMGLGVLGTGSAAQAAVPDWAQHFYVEVKVAGTVYTLDRDAVGTKWLEVPGPCHGRTLPTAARFRFKLYAGPFRWVGSKPHLTGPLVRDFGAASMLDAQYASWWIDAGGERARFRSIAGLQKRLDDLKKTSAEDQRAFLQLDCAENERRAGTEYALKRYVRNIRMYTTRFPDSTEDLAQRDFATDEISFERSVRAVFTVTGTAASGFVASVTDRIDGYRWTYTSTDDTSAESKV